MGKLLFVRQRFSVLGQRVHRAQVKNDETWTDKRGERSPRDASERALQPASRRNFRVYENIMIRSSGRNVTVQAESSGEARRTVMDMFPGALVTGVHRIRK